LCIIFGKDRAVRQYAQGLEDIEDELNKEDENDEGAKKDAVESLSNQEPSDDTTLFVDAIFCNLRNMNYYSQNDSVFF